MGWQEEGFIYELTSEYECADDDESFMTLKYMIGWEKCVHM